MDENTKYKKEHQGGKIVLKRARMVIVVEGQAVAINGEIQKFFIWPKWQNLSWLKKGMVV